MDSAVHVRMKNNDRFYMYALCVVGDEPAASTTQKGSEDDGIAFLVGGLNGSKKHGW